MSVPPQLKTWRDVPDLITLLRDRGIRVTDPEAAEAFIQAVGYYRLSGYTYPFRETDGDNHRFPTEPDFNDVIRLYRSDEALRSLLTQALRRIEINLRTRVASQIGKDDPLAHTRP